MFPCLKLQSKRALPIFMYLNIWLINLKVFFRRRNAWSVLLHAFNFATAHVVLYALETRVIPTHEVHAFYRYISAVVHMEDGISPWWGFESPLVTLRRLTNALPTLNWAREPDSYEAGVVSIMLCPWAFCVENDIEFALLQALNKRLCLIIKF